MIKVGPQSSRSLPKRRLRRSAPVFAGRRHPKKFLSRSSTSEVQGQRTDLQDIIATGSYVKRVFYAARLIPLALVGLGLAVTYPVVGGLGTIGLAWPAFLLVMPLVSLTEALVKNVYTAPVLLRSLKSEMSPEHFANLSEAIRIYHGFEAWFQRVSKQQNLSPELLEGPKAIVTGLIEQTKTSDAMSIRALRAEIRKSRNAILNIDDQLPLPEIETYRDLIDAAQYASKRNFYATRFSFPVALPVMLVSTVSCILLGKNVLGIHDQFAVTLGLTLGLTVGLAFFTLINLGVSWIYTFKNPKPDSLKAFKGYWSKTMLFSFVSTFGFFEDRLKKLGQIEHFPRALTNYRRAGYEILQRIREKKRINRFKLFWLFMVKTWQVRNIIHNLESST